MKNNKFKLGILFSGGKDSCYAAFLAKKLGYKLACLISMESENKDSYMFHTPSISQVKKQARVMDIPIIIVKTRGEKEAELIDLEKAIKKAVLKFGIKGVVTGAVESVYQTSRIQRICNNLRIECFNPLWQKSQLELLNELIENEFEVTITGIFAYPFDKKWLERKIDIGFIKDIKKLNEKYGISPSGEGGEIETLVLNCPLFKRKLKIIGFKDFGSKNSWIREIKVE